MVAKGTRILLAAAAALLAAQAVFGAQMTEQGSDIHVHVVFAHCRAGADGIYGQSAGILYACVGGREVCSLPGTHAEAIPSQLVEEYRRKGPIPAGRVAHHVERAILDAMQGLGNETAVRPAVRQAPIEAIGEEKIRQLSSGWAATEVVSLLGRPHMRIVGDGERWFYRLTNGHTANLEFAGGRLVDVAVREGTQ